MGSKYTKFTDDQMVRIALLIDDMEQSIEIKERLERLTDAEISALLFQEIWPNMKIYSPASELIEVAIKRLNGGEMPFEEEADE